MCRIFGPPIPSPVGFSVCELCFTDATTEEVAAALNPQVAIVPEALDEIAIATGLASGETVLAFILSSAIPEWEPNS